MSARFSLVLIIALVSICVGCQGRQSIEEKPKSRVDLANEGDVEAQLALARKLARGSRQQDRERAVHWFQLAAGQGSVQASIELGKHYYRVFDDPKSAFHWIKQGAECGDSDAQDFLAMMYEKGEGVEEDQEASVLWYRKSAIQGNPYSQNSLAMKLLAGEGTPKNLTEAYAWLLISESSIEATTGSLRENHSTLIPRLTNDFSDGELRTARAVAVELLEKLYDPSLPRALYKKQPYSHFYLKHQKVWQDITVVDKDRLKEANDLVSEGRDTGIREHAIEKYQEALELIEDFPPALRELAANEIRDGNIEKASEFYLRAIRHSPKSLETLDQFAWNMAKSDMTGMHKNLIRVAVNKIELAFGSQPDNAYLLNTLGVCYYRLAEWDKALACLEKSVTDGLDIYHNWLFIAMAKWKLGLKDEARELFAELTSASNVYGIRRADSVLAGFFDEAATVIVSQDVDGRQ